MSSNVATADGITEPGGLSQVARVVDVFVAPSATFRDILRNRSWWLPFILMVLSTLASGYTVQHQVGFERVTENAIHANPKREDALNQLPPEQRAQQIAIGAKFTAGITYGMPVLLLLGFAFYALVLWGGFNFLLGAETKFSQVFAVCMYASLPYLLLTLLVIISLYLGGNAENYDYNFPVGTSLGYYLPDVAPWLRTLTGRLDIIQLWTLALTTLGMSIIAKKTMMQSALITVGWWCVITLLTVGGAAFSS